jgi:hypothetical protein
VPRALLPPHGPPPQLVVTTAALRLAAPADGFPQVPVVAASGDETHRARSHLDDGRGVFAR